MADRNVVVVMRESEASLLMVLVDGALAQELIEPAEGGSIKGALEAGIQGG